jgi:hypothetical protein
MKANQFIKLLRRVIREEVQMAVRTELRILSESSIKQPARIFESKPPVVKNKTVQPKVRTPKQYASNPLLNEILNETTMYNNPIGEFEEWPTMGMNPAIHKSSQAPQILTDFEGRQVDVNTFSQTDAGAAVVDAITKDYSALMKAIDAKKGK